MTSRGWSAATMHLDGLILRPLQRMHRAARTVSSGAFGLAVSSLLLPAVLVQPESASAQGARYALTCIGTETGYRVNFAYRWGKNGEWTTTSVAPGKWLQLTWNYKYAGENRSPQLTIRYDDNTSTTTNIVRTDLNSYAASRMDCEDEGKTYNFYQRGSELYVREED